MICLLHFFFFLNLQMFCSGFTKILVLIMLLPEQFLEIHGCSNRKLAEGLHLLMGWPSTSA